MDYYVTASYVLKFLFLLLSGTAVLRLYLGKKRLAFLRTLGSSATNLSESRPPLIVGFFHPYANGGGGGERVLFTALRAVQRTFGTSVQCLVYTGDSLSSCSDSDILDKCRAQFGIALPHKVVFVRLRSRILLEASLYPRFTLIGQAIGSILVGIEAFWRAPCDLFIDTCGHAFTFPAVHLLSPATRIACYVHYPTVSTDMLADVRERRTRFNNSGYVARSWILSFIKIVYYRLFAAVYGACGRFADTVCVNSSWTAGHINEVWRIPQRTTVVFPPCTIDRFESIYRNRERLESSEVKRGSKKSVISIGQFRPEKNHRLQIDAFREFLETVGKQTDEYELVLLGGCRNEEDEQRVRELRAYAELTGVGTAVRYVVNAPLPKLEEEVLAAECALHSMTNEHFGICVVECMAAGLLTIAHKSGGPLSDIIGECNDESARCGWLATAASEYAAALKSAFVELSKSEKSRVRKNGLEAARRFSEDAFERSFMNALIQMLSRDGSLGAEAGQRNTSASTQPATSTSSRTA